jgi:hypothetical protein
VIWSSVAMSVSAAATVKCPTTKTGYLCIDGRPESYYECRSPYYVGWRACPTGTSCTDTSSLHDQVPCAEWKQASDSDDSDGTTGDWRKSGSSSSSSRVRLVVTARTWWVWVACAGVAFVVAVVAWLGSVTWPGTHERLALFTHRIIC